MSKLEITDVEQKLEQIVSNLGDPSLQRDLLKSEVEKPLPLSFGGATFTLKGGATISLFNSKDDEDTDGILSAGVNDDDHLKLAPQIEFNPANVWLKYRVGTGIKGSAETSLDELGFSLGVDGAAAVCSYRIHKPGDQVGQTALNDLGETKWIFSTDDIQNLLVGEAVSLHVRGSLNCKVIFSWADVFSSHLGILGGLLAKDESLAIEIGASAKANVKVEVKDGFVLVFSRVDADHLRFAVRKSDKRSLAADVQLSVGAKFANENIAGEVLEAAYEALAGTTIEQVDEILDHATLADLDRNGKEVAQRLLSRFGLDDELADLNDLKERWDKIKKGTQDRLKELAEIKAAIGFKYEYSRVKTSTAVLQTKLENRLLDQYHPGLLKGDVSGVLDAVRTGVNGFELEAYTNQETLTSKQSWGFSLGLGKWKAAGKDRKELTRVIRENIDRKKQVSHNGARGYEGQWGKNAVKWSVDFSAAMNGFSTGEQPSASEFEYGLHLTFERKEAHVRRVEIQEYVDHAVLWRAIPVGEFDDEVARLNDIVRKKKNVVFSNQVVFNHTAFTWLLAQLVIEPELRFGQALGAAMPWTKKYPQVRQSVSERRRRYGALWYDYLTDETITPTRLQKKAQLDFKKWGYTKLGELEGRGIEYARTTSIAGLADMNRRTREQWESFYQGATKLHQAILEGENHRQIRTSFTAMQRLWTQSHHVRALGRYLVEIARLGTDEVKAGVERILTVTYRDDDNKEQVLNLTQS